MATVRNGGRDLPLSANGTEVNDGPHHPIHILSISLRASDPYSA